MKTIDKIPTTKIQRASKLVQTGAKVGVNYLKYYGDKLVNSNEDAKERLNQNNAEFRLNHVGLLHELLKLRPRLDLH